MNSALEVAAFPHVPLHTMDVGVNVVVAAGILVWLMLSQVRRRQVRTRFAFPVILIVLGVFSVEAFVRSRTFDVGESLTLAASLLLDAVLLSAVRAYTVHLWLEDGAVWRRGTWLTVVLWLVGIAAHVGPDALAGAGTSTYLLYFGLALLTQRFVIGLRAARVGQDTRGAAGPAVGWRE